mgnify:FL=1|tara:strand:- start:125 stop:691 length:567 start_codon:yes stop_codon:yes gene_type:complete
MVAKLTDYIKCYDNMVDEFFCQSVIEAFKDSESSYLDREQRPSFSELNISKKYLEGDPLWKPIQSKMTKVLIDTVQIYMQDLGIEPDFPAKYAFEEHRMKMYKNNDYDQFKDHVDVGDYNSARRFLVCFLYLNTVGLGGETNFPRLDYAITPKCGTIALFPATWQYRHAGLPPKSGNKYIIGSYLHYV